MSARGVALGLLLEVRVLPMAAALLATLLGSAWATGHALPIGAPMTLALLTVFFGLYTAHLLDTYIDVKIRGDITPPDYPWIFRDSSGLIEPRSLLALAKLTMGMAILLGVLTAAAGGLLVGGCLAVGVVTAVAYSPVLDKTTAGVSFGYPTGVTAAMGAGYALSTGVLDARWALLALSIFMALAGTKIRSDTIDLADDATRQKKTIAVRFGAKAAHRGGLAITFGGLALAVSLPWMVLTTPLIAIPAAAAAVGVAASARLDPFKGSMLQAAILFALLAAEVLILL